MNRQKIQIAKSFSHHSGSYKEYATLQKISAGFMGETLPAIQKRTPAGPILEIGCGSGMLSAILVENFPGREFTLMDIAPGMIHECRDYLQNAGYDKAYIHFIEMDAETISEEKHYALIASGLTVQWFSHLQESLLKIYRSLLPGGVFIFSFLGDGSFPEWAAQCEKSQLFCTLNPLPDGRIIDDLFCAQKVSVQHWQKDILLHFSKVKDFFLSLKKTGAGVNVAGKNLTFREMKILAAQWESEVEGDIELTCNVHYFAITKR